MKPTEHPPDNHCFRCEKPLPCECTPAQLWGKAIQLDFDQRVVEEIVQQRGGDRSNPCYAIPDLPGFGGSELE